jgi:hypothetical protein
LAAVVRLAQELAVTQTPLGQLAPAGQTSTGVQVQVPPLAGPKLTMSPPTFPWQSAADA